MIRAEEKPLQLDLFSPVFVFKVPEFFSLSSLPVQEFIGFSNLLSLHSLQKNVSCLSLFLLCFHPSLLSLCLLLFLLTGLLYFSFLYGFGFKKSVLI